MATLTNITKSIRSLFTSNNKPNPFNEAFLWSVGGNSTTYDPLGPTYIKQGYQTNPIVYSVINQMATKCANVPFYVKEIEDDMQLKQLHKLNRATGSNLTIQQKIKKLQLESKAYSKEDMPFPMDRPNVSQTWSEFIALSETFLNCTGNLYWYMLSPQDGANAGEPLQVYVLPSHLMQITIKQGATLLGTESPVDGYMLISGRNYIEFEGEDVIHIKYPNPEYTQSGNHLYGQSPLRAALKNIESSNTALDLNIKTLKSGGAFGFIHAKNAVITPDQASEIKTRLQEMNSSPEDLSKIAGISAEIGFTRLSLTSDELRPFDYLNFDQKQICNVLGWNDILLNNDAGAKYDNVGYARKMVITDKIMPDLTLMSEALNSKFLPRFKGYENAEIIFDVMELPEMQEDISELTTWLNDALDRGVINRNEYRQAINYLEIKDVNMDKFTVKDDVITLAEAISNDFGTDEPQQI